VGYWYVHKDELVLNGPSYFKVGDVALAFCHGIMNGGVGDLFVYEASPRKSMILRRGQYGWYVAKSHPRMNFIHDSYLNYEQHRE